ncbi:MAG: apolipoprotein N-acyltransferase [Gemmatimonadota bacterium]
MSLPSSLRLPGRVRWLLLSAGLLGLAHPPFHLLIPSFIALIPFGVWLGGLSSDAQSRREALRGGYFLGLLYFTLVFYWLFTALVFYTWLALLAFVAPVLIMSGFLSIAALGTHTVRTRLGWPLWVGLPVFWTAMEWLRAHLGDVEFPWMGLGDTLTGFPWLIGAADLVGSRGLTLWLVLVNALLAEAILALRQRHVSGASARSRAWRLSLAALVVTAIPAAYSLQRWRSLETRVVAQVAVLQPNIPEDLKLHQTLASDSARAAIEWLVENRLSHDTATDLVLLPETVFPEHVDSIPSRGYPGKPRLLAWAAALSARMDAPVLFGALGADDRGNGEYDYYNSAFLVDSSGTVHRRYDKRMLVPIVERVPFVNPEWFRNVPFFGGFAVGGAAEPIMLDDSSFGVLICYESIFTQHSRSMRREGAEFLVNITNDAWFGRAEPWWSRSSALSQHPAHLVMRAIENRVGIARAANTGVSGAVDARGRWQERTELFVADARMVQIETTDGLTVYARFGDVAGWFAALLALLGSMLAGVRARSD